jgi:hypothetical protein
MVDIIEIKEAAHAVSAERNAAVYLYSGPIDGEGFGALLEAMQPSKSQPEKENTLLVLTTNGGLANSAYQIARTLQRASKTFELFVPQYCKSAGTLIALGAQKLIMEQIAELGPLDVQLYQKDEIGQRRSGLILKNALEGLSQETLQAFERIMLGIKVGSQNVVSFDTASRIAATITSAVMAPIYAQISPEALGNDLRDLNVAMEYGQRLADYGKNTNQTTVQSLVHKYPAHDFIIDQDEAKKLFKTVDTPDLNLTRLMKALGELVYTVQQPPLVVRLDSIVGEADDNSDISTEEELADRRDFVAERREGAGPGDPSGDEQRES